MGLESSDRANKGSACVDRGLILQWFGVFGMAGIGQVFIGNLNCLKSDLSFGFSSLDVRQGFVIGGVG